ncbi:DUF5963 family protein [Lactococcus formosensis]|uniref:DUF5963 family protein n=1 Tax=Lactococcus formosensis TaxID=1281486 RepID=UPI00339B2A62
MSVFPCLLPILSIFKGYFRLRIKDFVNGFRCRKENLYSFTIFKLERYAEKFQGAGNNNYMKCVKISVW